MGRVLIVDDNEDNLLLFQEYLEDNGFETVLASSGQQALDHLEEATVDVIVLDIHVIFVTAKFQDVDHVATGLYLGANDYLYKPVAEKELVARVAVMVRLKAAEDEVRRISVTDELTGLFNRRFLRQRLDEELSRARRAQTHLSVMLLDLDHFTRINDTYGHATGDEVLCAVSEVLQSGLRQGDVVGRWGGEEFLALLPNSDANGARITAERLRAAVESFDMSAIHRDLAVTASFGISVFDAADPEADAASLISRSDAAMYEAKQAGRNQVRIHAQPVGSEGKP